MLHILVNSDPNLNVFARKLKMKIVFVTLTLSKHPEHPQLNWRCHLKRDVDKIYPHKVEERLSNQDVGC